MTWAVWSSRSRRRSKRRSPAPSAANSKVAMISPQARLASGADTRGRCLDSRWSVIVGLLCSRGPSDLLCGRRNDCGRGGANCIHFFYWLYFTNKLVWVGTINGSVVVAGRAQMETAQLPLQAAVFVDHPQALRIWPPQDRPDGGGLPRWGAPRSGRARRTLAASAASAAAAAGQPGRASPRPVPFASGCCR